MQNLHQPSNFISSAKITLLEKQLSFAWCRETAYPNAQWSIKNRALGQCAVAALLINDLFGGTFADDKIHNHIWNIFPDGSHHDFTRQQFQTGEIIIPESHLSKIDILEHGKSKEMEIKERYELLKKRFKALNPKKYFLKREHSLRRQ